jgi:hypothetical protein
VLHYADNASAKTASMVDVLADGDGFAPDGLVSSKPDWRIDRRRGYRGHSDWGAGPAS